MPTHHEVNGGSAEISPEIAKALERLGEKGRVAYQSVELRHNTISHFVGSILEKGLTPESSVGVPDHEDVEFARSLLDSKGFLSSDKQKLFERFIAGRPADGSLGVYFYGVPRDEPRVNQGYGVPERMLILAQEMGYVSATNDSRFSVEDKKRAGEIYKKYRQLIYGGEGAHVAVFRADPMSPIIANTRLANLPHAIDVMPEDLLLDALSKLDLSEFHGIYIPGSIPPGDIELLDIQLPLSPAAEYLDPVNLDPSKSRFI